jgi:putative oxidoreductase
MLGTTAELTCPIMLVFGIGARLGAAALLGMTFVIQTFVYPDNWSEHLLWASILLYVLTRGAGVLSIDHVLSRWLLGTSAR